jgi:hypothetical protein
METRDTGWNAHGQRRIDIGTLAVLMGVYRGAGDKVNFDVSPNGSLFGYDLGDEATAQAAAETALRAFLASALKALGVDVEAMQAEGRRLFDENASLLRGWTRMEAALLQHRAKCPVAAWSDSDLSEALAGSTSALDAIKQQVRSEERARIVAELLDYANRARMDKLDRYTSRDHDIALRRAEAFELAAEAVKS